MMASANAQNDNALKMSGMLRDIDREYQLTSVFSGREIFPGHLRKIFAKVPRHQFVPPEMRDYAYENRPLPIGLGQTISQPFIVALMTDLLHPGKDDRILEVGCGCGYQAAVLSLLVAKVYSTEIISNLAEIAEKRLADLGYDNITVGNFDGYFGWPEHAPYDGIIVTAAAVTVPLPLVGQLKTGGKLVLPVGPQSGTQTLKVITKGEEGAGYREEEILKVAFVPLTGGHGED